MNEPTQNDQLKVDQHALDLLNGSIDGELSVSEQAELDALLAGSARVRDLNKELKALADTLDGVPEQQPPEYLHNAIISQVRLPVSADLPGQKTGLFSRWLAAPWMRTGLALAAGVLMTVGIYQTGSENLSPEDASRMTGTVMKNPAGVLLDSTSFQSSAMNGNAELRAKNGLLSIDIHLESDGEALFSLGFAGQSLELVSVNGLNNPEVDVAVSDDSVKVTGSGTQHYELLLRSTAVSAANLGSNQPGPIALEFFADSVLVHEAELDSSQ